MACTHSSPQQHHQPRLLEGRHPQQPMGEGTEETQAVEETRNWAELPRDALLAVLHRLGHADVLIGAEQVCRPWCRAAREEPELWRCIDLRHRAALHSSPHVNLEAMAYAALRRSAGQCETFWAEGVGDDVFIFFLTYQAPTLKSLRLISCNNISTHGLHEAIRKFPMLEELELSLYSGTDPTGLKNLSETCTTTAEACPLLKRLRLTKYRFHWMSNIGDSEAMEIAKMRGLRFLQLFRNSLSKSGLAAILDNCVRLEFLDIRHCFNVEMDDEMRAKCARLQTVRLPDESMDDYDLNFGSPEMNPGSPEVGMNFGFRGDILWDSW